MTRIVGGRLFGMSCLLFGLAVSVYLLSGATFLGYDGAMMC